MGYDVCMTTNHIPTGTPILSHVLVLDNADDPQLVALGIDGYSVHPIWCGVDRPDVGGWMVKDRKMADRLTSAILTGAAFERVEYAVDVNGQTYVAARHAVMGKRMNADLKRLGF